MKFIILFYKYNFNIGVGAIWADGSKGMRMYGDQSRDYPRPIFYDDRKAAKNHARHVVRLFGKTNKNMNLDYDCSYQILPIYGCK
jgi:hypothetical protein